MIARFTTKHLSATRDYFAALTGLRAVVAYLVFFYHCFKTTPTNTLPLLSKWLIRVVQQGHIGVSVFFVLSGFLITNRYGHSLSLKGPWFWKYMQNRFARIYPIYFLLTVLTFVVMIVRPQYDWDEWTPSFTLFDKVAAILLNLTLTRSYFQDLWLLGVGTAWTLTIEETFYLCAPFLLVGLRRNRWNFALYPLLFLLTGFLLVAVCQRFLPYYGLMNEDTFMLCRTFFGRCSEFFVGIALAFWLNRYSGAGRQAVGGCRFTVLGVVGIGACMLAMALNEHHYHASIRDFYTVYIGLTNFLLPLPVAALLWGLIHERSWLRLLLQTNLFDLLGKSSYVFYLIHQGVIDDFFGREISGNILVRLVAYSLLSIGLYTWVEKPLHQRLRAATRLAPVVATATVPALS
ncbi:MAG: acyltransferase family protein [Janthinobacterium lividum]